MARRSRSNYLVSGGRLGLNTTAILNDISLEFNDQLRGKLELWTDEYKRNVSDRTGIREANAEMADIARNTVISAYKNSYIGKRDSYRFGDLPDQSLNGRFANGKLLAALSDKNFITFNAARISFANTKILDSAAWQWKRLNFGAGTKGEATKVPEMTPMEFFGKRTNRVAQIENFGPRPSFTMPNGFWSSTAHQRQMPGLKYARPKGINDYFYLRSNGSAGKRPTKGILGASFLEEGAQSINLRYPELVTRAINIWANNANAAIKR